MKRILLAFALTFLAAPAYAATCSVVSPQLKDNTPQTFNAPYVDDGTGTGDCQPKIAQGLAGAAAAAWYEQIIQGGAVLSATNGLYGNILQGNAALSATNGIYANLLQGNAVNAVGNPFFVSPGTGATWAVTGTFWPYTLGQQLAASSVPVVLTAAQLTTLTPPTTVTANLGTLNGAATAANQSTMITSLASIATNTGAAIPAGTALIGKVGIDQTTPGTTNGVQVNAALPAGTNIIGKTGIDQTTFGTTNGVVSAANTYNTIAASQTAQAMTGGGGGATGDYLSHCVVVPTSTSPGVVTILDNSTAIYSFPGGASKLSNLVPFTIPVGAKSTSGAWKITTGASLSVVCVGHFT